MRIHYIEIPHVLYGYEAASDMMDFGVLRTHIIEDSSLTATGCRGRQLHAFLIYEATLI